MSPRKTSHTVYKQAVEEEKPKANDIARQGVYSNPRGYSGDHARPEEFKSVGVDKQPSFVVGTAYCHLVGSYSLALLKSGTFGLTPVE